MTSPLDKLARRIKSLEDETRASSTQPQLAFSSIEDGAITAFETSLVDASTGEVSIQQTMQIGKQYDGSSVAAVLTGPVPLVIPTAPAVEAVPGGARVAWGGTFTELLGVAPMDFAGVDVVVGAEPGFDRIATPPHHRFTSARGGEIFLPLAPGTYYVALVLRTLPGKASTPSTAVEVTTTAIEVGEPPVPDAPVASPDALVGTLGIGALQATWPAVEDAADYLVYVSASAIDDTPDPADLFAETAATSISISNLPDGTPLAVGTIYNVRVVARNAGGVAPTPGAAGTGAVRQADSSDISPSYVYTGGVSANQIEAGDLTANIGVVGSLIAGDPEGKHIEMSGADGFRLLDLDGQPLVHFPTDVEQPNRFVGELVAQGFTTKGAAQFQGTDNEISVNSELVLASGVTPPALSPSFNPSYVPTVPNSGKAVGQGLHFDGTEFRTLQTVRTSDAQGSNTEVRHYVRRFNPATGAEAAPVQLTFMAHYNQPTPTPTNAAISDPWALTKVGNTLFVFYGALQTYNDGSWWPPQHYRPTIGGFDATTGQQITYWDWTAQSMREVPPTGGIFGGGGLSLNRPAICSDEADNVYIGQVRPSDGRVVIKHFNAGTGAFTTVLTTNHVVGTSGDSGYTESLAALLYDDFDYGSGRWLVHGRGVPEVAILDTAGNKIPDECWTHPNGGNTATYYVGGGVAWDGVDGRFYAQDVKNDNTTASAGTVGNAWQTQSTFNTGYLRKMSKVKVARTVRAAMTWYDSDPGGTGTHETTIGPLASVTRQPRYGVVVSGSQPTDSGDPDSPDSHRLYAYEGSSYVDATSLRRQTLTEHGGGWYVYQAASWLDDMPTDLAAPPSTNSFPEGNSAILRSDLGGFVLKGDGTGSWPFLTQSLTTEVDNKIVEVDNKLAEVDTALATMPDTLDELTDVTISATPTNGEVLVYDLATSQWKPQKRGRRFSKRAAGQQTWNPAPSGTTVLLYVEIPPSTVARTAYISASCHFTGAHSMRFAILNEAGAQVYGAPVRHAAWLSGGTNNNSYVWRMPMFPNPLPASASTSRVQLAFEAHDSTATVEVYERSLVVDVYEVTHVNDAQIEHFI